jgi:hypothetical protein
LSRFGKAIIAVALALSIGAQWPLLQSIAWLNMLVTFSTQEGVQEAVVKTFDGKNPCRLCKFVEEGKQAEKKSQTKDAVKKLDATILATSEIQIDQYPFQLPPEAVLFFQSRSYPPLSPPPDLA